MTDALSHLFTDSLQKLKLPPGLAAPG
jgi:hypothetical protein